MPKCPYYPGVRIKCVNMDTKGTCRSVRIIRVSVLSGLPGKKVRTSVLLVQGLEETFLWQQKGLLL